MSLSFGSLPAYSDAIGIQRFWSPPADNVSMPVSTPSMSTRLASCCALILPGSSGAGALAKEMRDTSFGFLLRYSSIAFCVSARLPATSTILSVTGEVGSGRFCANARKSIVIEPARPAAPPTTTARLVGLNVMSNSSVGYCLVVFDLGWQRRRLSHRAQQDAAV